MPGTEPEPLLTAEHGGMLPGVCEPALPGVGVPGVDVPGLVVPGVDGEVCEGLVCPGVFCVPGVEVDGFAEFGVEL